MKPCIQDLKDDLEGKGLNVDVGDGYVNISRPDGLNCEFYPCYDASYTSAEVLTATYTIDGVEKELDFELPYDHDECVETILKILGPLEVKRRVRI